MFNYFMMVFIPDLRKIIVLLFYDVIPDFRRRMMRRKGVMRTRKTDFLFLTDTFQMMKVSEKKKKMMMR